MSKIVRTPSRVTGGITEQEAEALKAHTAKWIANAMSTEPVAPERLVSAIKALYAAGGLKEPRVVVVPSPVVMAFAGGFAAAIWWARKNGPRALKDRLATSAATSAATDAATYAATSAATDAVTRAATSAATYAATDAATRAATSAATDAVTRAATSAATYAVTYAVTRAATYAATRAEQFSRLATQISDEFGIDRGFLLMCAQRWYGLYQGGNMWSYWDCYLTAFRDVLGLALPQHEKYRAWEACAIEGGFRLMHEEFCIVSDRPEVLKVDEQNRPHCADGPSHRWRDGWSLYHWHGMRLPDDREYIIHSPHLITVEDIESERNAEIRRVMIDRYGPARYVTDSGAIVVQELPADHEHVGLRTGRLLRKDVPEDEPIIYVDLLNSTPEPDGTVKRYMLRVDPNAYGGEASRNVQAAAASTWRNTDGSLAFKRWQDYSPIAES